MPPRLTRLGLLVLAAVAPAPLFAATSDLERLLATSDPFADAPAELRLAAAVTSPPSRSRTPIEIWRRGDELLLVRFLAPRDRGKYVVRRADELWFLAPGSARPVRLAPALAPAAGAALDALLAARPARDYRIAGATEAAGLVTFELEARDEGARVPRLRWVVDRERRVPVRAELLDASGRVERLVELRGWSASVPKRPATIVLKEVARGGRPVEIELLAFESRPVPTALFDLEDPRARSALPPPPASP
jgi:hypothetical protein